MWAEWLSELFARLIELTGELLPRLPSALRGLGDAVRAFGANLAKSVPYSGLIPWGVVQSVATLVPSVVILSWAAQLAIRALAWVRSRGAANE